MRKIAAMYQGCQSTHLVRKARVQLNGSFLSGITVKPLLSEHRAIRGDAAG